MWFSSGEGYIRISGKYIWLPLLAVNQVDNVCAKTKLIFIFLRLWCWEKGVTHFCRAYIESLPVFNKCEQPGLVI